MYANGRFYHTYLNRFISADPIVPNPKNPQSLNRYSYVNNNPINFLDPSGHRECASSDWCAAGSQESHYQPPNPLLLPIDLYEPPSDLITHLPLAKDEITWQSGFGPNSYATDTCGQTCYSQSHNIHTGGDFGGIPGSTVYATVGGTIVDLYAEDGEPNVVIAVTVGNITYYVVHGHTTRDTNLRISDLVEAGSIIGTLVEGGNHVHLGIRRKTMADEWVYNGQDRAYNPLLFMDSGLTVEMDFVSKDYPYYGNESPTSIRSFLYGTGSYYEEDNQRSMGIIR